MSTSRRTEWRPDGVISTAPEARCRALDEPPKAGRNSTPGAAERNVVPIPWASATNARGNAVAKSSTRANSCGRSAGRSALSAATAAPRPHLRTDRAPCSSAALSPAAGVSATVRAPRADSAAPATGSSVTTTTSRTAGQASAAATVSCANARAAGPQLPAHRAPQPALGPGQRLQRDDQGPGAGRVGVRGDLPLVRHQHLFSPAGTTTRRSAPTREAYRVPHTQGPGAVSIAASRAAAQ